MAKIFLILLFNILALGQASPKCVYSYTDALNFYIKNQHLMTATIMQQGEDKSFVTSILFPELIRYSIYKDFFETKALEIAYVQGGSNYADFSIGRFQMKPSFVEQLESVVGKNSDLTSRYGYIRKYTNNDEKAIRRERVSRLQSLLWQIRYACCFVAIENKIVEKGTINNYNYRLKYYAAAYNYGFQKTPKEIKSWMDIKAFPYGKKYRMPQMAYSAVALDFYQNYYNSIFNVNNPS